MNIPKINELSADQLMGLTLVGLAFLASPFAVWHFFKHPEPSKVELADSWKPSNRFLCDQVHATGEIKVTSRLVNELDTGVTYNYSKATAYCKVKRLNLDQGEISYEIRGIHINSSARTFSYSANSENVVILENNSKNSNPIVVDNPLDTPRQLPTDPNLPENCTSSEDGRYCIYSEL